MLTAQTWQLLLDGVGADVWDELVIWNIVPFSGHHLAGKTLLQDAGMSLADVKEVARLQVRDQAGWWGAGGHRGAGTWGVVVEWNWNELE